MSTRAAALNRAFNNTDATVAAFAATVADLSANEIAAANKFDVPTLTDAALAKQVMTNMGFLPSTVAAITQLETELAAYFGGMGKGNRGFVVLQLSNILTGLTADATYGAIATAWNAEVAASLASSVPGTFALTTATTDNLVGSSGDDIFTAINAALAAAKTLNPTDKIEGGTGNDTLKIDVSTAWDGFTTGSVANVETIEITNSGSAVARNFVATGITGAKTITVNAAGGNVPITELPTGVTAINLSNLATPTAAATFSTGFVAAAAETLTTSTSDAVALGLNTVGSTEIATVTLAGFETLNVTATGTNNVTFGGTDARTINLNSAAAITVNNVSTATTVFDASASAGAVTVTTSNAADAALKTLRTGAGDDIATVVLGDLTGNATIAGGAGTKDNLRLSAAATRSVELNMSGFETLTLGNIAGAVVMSGAKTTDLATVAITGVSTGVTGVAAAVEFANMGAKNMTFTSNGATASTAVVTSDHTGTTNINFVTALTATTKSDATTAGSKPEAQFTANSATGALVVDVGAYIDTSDTTTPAISASKASAVTLTVNSGVSAAGVEKTKWDGRVVTSSAQSVTITNNGVLTTGAEVEAVKATSATLVNGTNAGVFELDVDKATNVSITTGSSLNLLTSTAVSDFQSVDTLTVVTNNGTTTLPDLPKAATVTLSGTGSTAKVEMAAVAIGGAAGNDYGLTVTATGLKAGLNVGQIQVAAGFDVNLNLTGVTGPIDFADINRTGIRGKDVIISANGAGGAFDVGAIYATGTVTVNASATTGNASVGDIFGDNVTVNLSSSGVGSILGSQTASIVEAKTSANITIHELTDKTTDTYTINAASGSKNLAVTFNGGIVADTVNITGVTGQTGITVTGNFGAGSDVINVNSFASTVAQTISLAGATNYTSSTIISGSGADVITGGEGADTIFASLGADTFDGGAGADIFVFGANTSTVLSVDTINNLGTTDQIVSSDGITTLQTTLIAGVATTGSEAAAVSVLGVATFTHLAASFYDTFAEKVALIDAIPLGTLANGKSVFFSDGGFTYLFIGDDSATSDVVIKLTGVSIPTAAVVAGATTGITAFAA